MKNKLPKTLFLAAIFMISFYNFHGENTGLQKPEIKEPRDKDKVINHLLEDWKKPMHSTSIYLAMSALSIEQNDDLRLEIGKYFRENTDLADNLLYYGANNYILSNDEKLIARYIINTFKKEGQLPVWTRLSKAVGLSKDQLQKRLSFMERAGFLKKDESSKLGFILTDEYDNWGGPLRYNFHTIRIKGEKPYDVWCAVDFLLEIGKSENKDKIIKIEDSCVHCGERIYVETKAGQITKISNESVIVLRGGS